MLQESIKSAHANTEQPFTSQNSSAIGMSQSGIFFNLVSLLTNE